MGVESYMKRVAKQTAVYWGTPVADKFGKNSFVIPIEIKCLWSDKKELMIDDNGKETISKAVVYVLQDLDEQGMLFLGLLTDLTTAQKDDPAKVKNAYEIRQFLKIPSLTNTRRFNRKVLLWQRQ